MRKVLLTNSFLFVNQEEKSESEIIQSQPTPTNSSLYPSSSPTTTSLIGSAPLVQHYYPPVVPHPHHPSVQQNVLYPHHIPPAPSNGLYSIQPYVFRFYF